ncbi:methyltransferase, TIGR04325 family [Nitratireductor kimnyeongensis]|uniref:Methyltransferase, TIGR04325 family n=1 Tax=Nitratireductor kimnyeongensis TaxID=430679 RepID=A0ABW0T8X8_9HYPH|nr:methyltransferase, TIGR04325 family [Nitratireductor kimnyeongensis]QZZ35699.1 methyltransferase, TIGR04325 family [Nitratireductor kimnyeongensis]
MSLSHIKQGIKRVHGTALLPFQAAAGRMRMVAHSSVRFSGVYANYHDALSAASRRGLAGYDHDTVAGVAFEQMCRLMPWDYPVLFWLSQLRQDIRSLLDAGGHMGTKFRAFRGLLPEIDHLQWTVYDVPAIVKAGEKRARDDGIESLRFTGSLDDRGPYDLFLGSGLLQYLDLPLPDLLGRLVAPPKHLLLNKVALRKGRTIVTLERIGPALVPYQIRSEASFLEAVEGMGYRVVDRWTIPSLSHVIDTHPEYGASESAGFYCVRD